MERSLNIFLLLLGPWMVQAAERYEFFSGVRQNGMGGASVAVANDETSLLSNPATLGKLRGFIFTIADPEVTFGQDNVSLLGQRGFTDMMNPQTLLEATQENSGKHWHGKAQLFPSFVATNFGIGVFAKQEYNAETDTEADLFTFDYTYDLALVLGYSLRLFDGRIKIGAAGRYINRVEAHEQITASTATDLKMGDLVKEGGAIAGDVGLVLTAPWTLLPTLAGVWRDVGHTTFSLNEGHFYRNGRRPDVVEQSVDVAFSLSPIHANHIRSTITGEYRDILTYSKETDHMRRIHAGVEVNFYDMIFLRGGMNQRYWTAGMEFAFRYFQLQAATYGEEIGTPTQYKEDRRYIGKISIRF